MYIVHSITHCHHVHYATSKYVCTSNVGSIKWLMASCPRHRALRIVNVYTLYMLQRFRFPPSGCCLVHFTLEIVFSTVLLYCCAVLCDESHNIFTLNIEINKSIQVNTPTRSLLMLTLHLPFRNVITRVAEVWTPTKILNPNIRYKKNLLVLP